MSISSIGGSNWSRSLRFQNNNNKIDKYQGLGGPDNNSNTNKSNGSDNVNKGGNPGNGSSSPGIAKDVL